MKTKVGDIVDRAYDFCMEHEQCLGCPLKERWKDDKRNMPYASCYLNLTLDDIGLKEVKNVG